MRDFMAVVPSILWIALTSVPIFRLLRRGRIHGAWLAVNIMPVLGTLILLWIIAYWPDRLARS